MILTEREYSDPSISMESQPYWTGAKDGRLLLKVCDECRKPHFYPRAICPHCACQKTHWVNASGRGNIYTYSVMRRAKTPYVIAYVTLEEGVTLLTNIVECDADGLEVGQAVEVTFRTTQGGESLPVFRPANPWQEQVETS